MTRPVTVTAADRSALEDLRDHGPITYLRFVASEQNMRSPSSTIRSARSCAGVVRSQS
jgi:hypothetical protein